MIKAHQKLYQNIEAYGEEFFHKRPQRKNSKFFNEGKWLNFIEPLLPSKTQDQVFIDVGCNAGMFLRMAKDWGFRDVIGIEKNKTPIANAKRYRDALNYKYKLLHWTIGSENFKFDELPVADVTLLANVHYHLHISWWLDYLDKLQHKTCYCLVVSAPDKESNHMPRGDYHSVRGYFRDWEEIGAVNDISEEGDPAPRGELFSVLFRSRLRRRKMKSIDIADAGGSKENDTYGTLKQLTKEAMENDNIKMEDTDYYKKWVKWRGEAWGDRQFDQFVGGKFKLALDIRDNGLKKPILVHANGRLADGRHRMAILEGLGHKSIITRMV